MSEDHVGTLVSALRDCGLEQPSAFVREESTLDVEVTEANRPDLICLTAAAGWNCAPFPFRVYTYPRWALDLLHEFADRFDVGDQPATKAQAGEIWRALQPLARDPNRACSDCGFYPPRGWPSAQCPRHFDPEGSSCEGTLIKARPRR